ncbi:hypothetical protein [Streptomyces sp. NPDC059566]|uniref:hypothetical protein n=1 Tax=Streptomyces sp. NPDC059566 TaxID=3346866 RepID=UPI00369ECCCE
MQHNRFYAKTPQTMGVVKATADLNGVPLPLREFSAQFRTRWLTRRFTWGIRAAVAPLTPGQYVLEIKATAPSPGNRPWEASADGKAAAIAARAMRTVTHSVSHRARSCGRTASTDARARSSPAGFARGCAWGRHAASCRSLMR